MKWAVLKLEGYETWFATLSKKVQAQTQKRLLNVEEYGHFGTMKDLKGGLWELKFNNGNRIYYARTGTFEITLILGGSKNGQEKDIKKAKALING